MASVKVYLDDNLPPEEKANLMISLKQLRGVLYLDESETSVPHQEPAQAYAPPAGARGEAPPSYAPQPPPVFAQPSHPHAPPYGQQTMPYQNYAQAVPGQAYNQQPPPIPPTAMPGQTPQGMRDTEAMGLNTQRHAINHAIKWAVKKQLINLEELKYLSPEDTVQRAMKFIDMMPEEEKQRLGQDLSNFYS